MIYGLSLYAWVGLGVFVWLLWLTLTILFFMGATKGDDD